MSLIPITPEQKQVESILAGFSVSAQNNPILKPHPVFIRNAAATYMNDGTIKYAFNDTKFIGKVDTDKVYGALESVLNAELSPLIFSVSNLTRQGANGIFTLAPITPRMPVPPPNPIASSSMPAGPSAVPPSSSPLPPPNLLGLNPITGLTGPPGAPSVAGTNLSLSSQVSMSSTDIKKALNKAQSGRDVEINEREFRDIIRKYPHIARLARRSAEETLKATQDAVLLRSAIQELVELDEIQRASFSTIDGEIPLKIKKPRDVPLSQRRVGRTWVRKPVGL